MNELRQIDSMSDLAAEQQQMEEARKADALRIFSYLEPHVAPNDIEMVLWFFGIPIPKQPVDFPQMPLGWNGED